MVRPRYLALVAAALLTTAAAAGSVPRSIPIPDDFAPEGVAVGARSTFFVGSLKDGDIYRGSLRNGQGSLLVDTSGRQAAGLEVEQSRKRLWVAGGATGRLFAYDTRSGATVADVPLAPAGTSLLNDVVVTGRAVYVTDSFSARVFVVPLSPRGRVGTPSALTVTGPASAVIPGQPGLNGIEATRHGTLVVGHTALGGLYTLDPRTGVSRAITLPAGAVPPGVSNRTTYAGPTLWVVENFANQIVGIRLSRDLTTGTVQHVVTNADVGGLFRIPTTLDRHGDRLVVVNARFDVGLPPPFGTGAPPGTDYDVVVFRP